MVKCEEFQQQLSQFIDDDLPGADSSALFGHLAMCDECRLFLQRILYLRTAVNEEVTNHVLELLAGQMEEGSREKKRSEPDRPAITNFFRNRRISLSIRTIALIETSVVALVILCWSLWYQYQHPVNVIEPGHSQVVTFPIVEVRGTANQR